jgi:hypothetical protein
MALFHDAPDVVGGAGAAEMVVADALGIASASAPACAAADAARVWEVAEPPHAMPPRAAAGACDDGGAKAARSRAEACAAVAVDAAADAAVRAKMATMARLAAALALASAPAAEPAPVAAEPLLLMPRASRRASPPTPQQLATRRPAGRGGAGSREAAAAPSVSVTCSDDCDAMDEDALAVAGVLALRAPRRGCTRCGTQKTPQWRAGPAGPRSLCNACGVRQAKRTKALSELAQQERACV